MMPNVNIKVVRQHQMVVVWIRLRHMKRLKETKINGQSISVSLSLHIYKYIMFISVIN